MGLSRILLVDDSRSSLETMEIFFQLEGFDVKTAKNGEEAITVVREFHPELVLIDLQMPVMDGYDGAKGIRALPLDSQPFLVALTGWEPEKVKDLTEEAGFNRMMKKPVSPVDIRALLAEF